MLHNHPGYRAEKPKPSREDDCSTLRVMIAADFMGIPLRDHIIVSGGTGSCYSYRTEYGDKFNPMDMGKLFGEGGLDAVFAEPDRYAEYKPLPFENEVRDYIEKTDNHVLYRVTPIFEGENLLAKGVIMEAYSIEDKGKGICYNVFVYNVQPGIEIDYSNGDSYLEKS